MRWVVRSLSVAYAMSLVAPTPWSGFFAGLLMIVALELAP